MDPWLPEKEINKKLKNIYIKPYDLPIVGDNKHAWRNKTNVQSEQTTKQEPGNIYNNKYAFIANSCQ